MEKMQFEPYNGEDFEYFPIPRIFFEENSKYKKMSAAAKIMYGVLLDQTTVQENQDANGQNFIYYGVDEATRDTNIQRREIAKGLRELEAAGLIRRERKKGEPNIIYVTDIIDYKNLTNN